MKRETKNYITTYLIFSFAPVIKRMIWQRQELFQSNLKEFLEWLIMQALFFLFIMGLLWLLFFVCGKFSKKISIIIKSPWMALIFMTIVLGIHTLFLKTLNFYCLQGIDLEAVGGWIIFRECVTMKSFNMYELSTIIITPTILTSNFDKVVPVKAVKKHFQKYLQV